MSLCLPRPNARCRSGALRNGPGDDATARARSPAATGMDGELTPANRENLSPEQGLNPSPQPFDRPGPDGGGSTNRGGWKI